MTYRRWALLLVLALLAPTAAATSTVHAFLDRNNVSLGDTVTLNIRAHGSIGTPNLDPLRNNFRILGTSRSRSFKRAGGKVTRTSELGIALKPRHAGTLSIPALDVGGAKTAPLTLHVGAAPAGGTGTVGDPAFMRASVGSSAPYIDQQTVYTVRLFYQPGVHGSLGNPHADGARLIRLDRDHRYRVQRMGYTYDVIERSWALIPERRGAITVDGPVFHGQRTVSVGPNSLFSIPGPRLGLPNVILNGPFHGPARRARTVAPAVTINARAAPRNAGKPWLPARKVQLKLTGLPSDGKVDAATPLTLTLSIRARGQPAGALPQPQLPPIAGARIYPDQTQDSTGDRGKWLQGKRIRSFAILPERNGKLTIPEITLNWWNVVDGRPERAIVPAHTLAVHGIAASSGQAAAPAAGASSATSPHTLAPATSAVHGSHAATASPASTWWRDVALASFALWVIAVAAALSWWVWVRRAWQAAVSSGEGGASSGVSASPAQLRSSQYAGENRVAAPPPRVLKKRALDAAHGGDASACEHALLAWARAARTGVAHVGALRDQLADPAQCQALDALQHARWKEGDPEAACAAVARAFAHGFDWRDDDGFSVRAHSALPPLYPS